MESHRKSVEVQWETQRQLNAATDKRIADLVSAIGALIDRPAKWG